MPRTLSELVSAFENATLPRAEWTHEAHLSVAWAFCRAEGDETKALERMRTGIRRFNAATGVVDGPWKGYHETLTMFWVRHVAAFVREHPGPEEEALPLLLEVWSDSRAPLRFYSKRVLMHPSARFQFAPPDKQPFDTEKR